MPPALPGESLLQIADGRQLWAGQYDEQLTSIFDIQDAISERVTRKLTLRLSPQEARGVARRDTRNAAAYELYLKGRFFLSLAQPRNAIEMFEQAVRLEPASPSPRPASPKRLAVCRSPPTARPARSCSARERSP